RQSSNSAAQRWKRQRFSSVRRRWTLELWPMPRRDPTRSQSSKLSELARPQRVLASKARPRGNKLLRAQRSVPGNSPPSGPPDREAELSWIAVASRKSRLPAQEALTALRRLHARMGRPLSSADVGCERSPLYRDLLRHFDSIEKARRAAGVPSPPPH